MLHWAQESTTIVNIFLTRLLVVCPIFRPTFALYFKETIKQIIPMKKVALVISLFTLIFAFTVSTASAQKVTSAEKAKTEKVSTSKDAKSCCSKSEAKSSAACTSAEKSGCAKSCSGSAASKSCCSKGEAKAEATPVPKKN